MPEVLDTSTKAEPVGRGPVQDSDGWGLIQPLMRDNHVTEVRIDGPDKIGYTRDGQDRLYTDDYPRAEGQAVAFESAAAIGDWLQNLIQSGERALTYESPILDADLPGGARLQATIPPVSEHLAVNIRKSGSQTPHDTMDDWVGMHVLSAAEGQWLRQVTAGYANIMVVGPDGSETTTGLRILIEAGVSPQDRIVLLEDRSKMQAKHPQCVSVRVPSREPAMTATEIYAAALQKHPNRVVFSELQTSEETVAFLQTIATGHSGALTSQHGETPEAVIRLLVARARQGGWGAMAESMVFAFVDVLVFVRPMKDQKRRVTRIVEVVPQPLWAEHGKFRDIFRWDARSDTHRWLTDPLAVHLEPWEFADRAQISRCPSG